MQDRELIQKLIEQYEKHAKRFSEWEEGFINSVRNNSFLSDNQRSTAQRIVAEKSASKESAAAAKTDIWEGSVGCDRCEEGVVVMVRGLNPGEFWKPDKPRWGGERKEWPKRERYVEQAFPCTCDQGELRQRWQKWGMDAAAAWGQGWRRKDHYMEEAK